MRIKTARVYNYKSVSDSTQVELDERVTCLVGKNESGKTAFLEAMYRWKPLPTGHPDTYDGLRDFPRSRWSLERGNVPSLEVVTMGLTLDEADVTWADDQFGKGVLTSRSITRSRKYDNSWTVSGIEVDEGAYVRSRVTAAALNEALPSVPNSVEELVQSLDTLALAEAQSLATELREFDLEEHVRSALRGRYPSFLYFDEYSVLPGRVSIPRLQLHEGDLDSGERTALALLKLAGVATEDFSEEDYEARKAALEAASNVITAELFQYWSQNQDLLVELDLDFKSPQGVKAGEVAPYLDIRIRNLRHGVSLNFGERSAGFVWFFSFLAAFSEYRNSDDPLVLLLDEPGLGLHAAAQGDLLRYIEERLAPGHQVVYTTHSPFMIDAVRLERVRTVEDLPDKGTTITRDVVDSHPDTLFPLQAALGYELAQTLFVGPDNIVVEGPADLLYMTVMSDHLRSIGKATLNARWVIVPVGGLDKIPTFIALLGAHLNVAVVMDVSAGGSQKINSLIERGVIAAKRVVPLNIITGGKEADIEDLFDEDFYLHLVRASGVGTIERAALPPGTRIVKRTEKVVGVYDHYRPARHLLENPALLGSLDDVTVQRFGMLFEQLNGLLT